MPRLLILEKAGIISKGRGKDHGPLYRSFGGIAAMWSAYLSAVHYARTGDYREFALNRRDVAQMLIHLKQMRAEFGNESEPDNYVDIAGYAAIAGELSGVYLEEDVKDGENINDGKGFRGEVVR